MSDTLPPVNLPRGELRRKLDRERAEAIAGQTRDTVRCPVCSVMCGNGRIFEAHLEHGCLWAKED